jgi:hypothetical protein
MSAPILLAHHALLIALPFVAPCLLLLAGLGFLIVRDRRAGR